MRAVETFVALLGAHSSWLLVLFWRLVEEAFVAGTDEGLVGVGTLGVGVTVGDAGSAFVDQANIRDRVSLMMSVTHARERSTSIRKTLLLLSGITRVWHSWVAGSRSLALVGPSVALEPSVTLADELSTSSLLAL